MRLINIVVFSAFMFTASVYPQDVGPNWASRERIVLRGEELIWVLGRGSSESLERAKDKSDLDAKKNMAEYLSPKTSFLSKSSLLESEKSEVAKNNVFTHSSLLTFKLHQKRVFVTTKNGSYIVKTDIAIRIDDYENSLASSVEIPFEKAFTESELTSGLKDRRKTKNREEPGFLDKRNMITWVPLSSEGVAELSFAYERSFFQRLMTAELFFSQVEESDSDKKTKSRSLNAIDLGASVYRSGNSSLEAFFGIQEEKVLNYGETNSKHDDKSSSDSSLRGGVKYKRKLMNCDCGVRLQIHQDFSRNKKDAKTTGAQSSLGFFIQF